MHRRYITAAGRTSRASTPSPCHAIAPIETSGDQPISLAGTFGVRSSRPSTIRLLLELQAFLESWLRYLKERVIWRNVFETIDQARAAIGAYVDHATTGPIWVSTTAPKQVGQTWVDAREEFDGLQKQAA